jgi:hypothetical protein
MFWQAWPGRDRRSTDGYVYVVVYSTGAVKVGATRNPRQRMDQLSWAAAQFGVELSRGWLSDSCADYREREAALLAHAARCGPRIGSETYRAAYEDVRAAAQRDLRTHVPGPRVDSPRVMRRAERREEARALHASGRSYRAIAAELGVSLGTVHAYCTA